MKDTKVLVSDFRDMTVNMLESIKKEDYDKLNILIEQRQKIIATFEKNPEIYDKNTIQEEFKAKDIFRLDQEVNDLTKKHFLNIKEKLRSVSSNIKIKNKYNPGFSGNSLFFNKKVF